MSILGDLDSAESGGLLLESDGETASILVVNLLLCNCFGVESNACLQLYFLANGITLFSASCQHHIVSIMLSASHFCQCCQHHISVSVVSITSA